MKPREPSADDWAVALGRARRQQRRAAARSPKPIERVLSRLMLRRGYGRVLSTERLVEAWRQAAGEALARQTRPAGLRGGKLTVVVASSVARQELVFQQAALLKKLTAALPDERITALRFRVGAVE